jgi:putative phage-type endonuclease
MDAELRKRRLGKMSASSSSVIMGGLNTDTLEALVKRLAFERTFGDTGEDGYQSKAMERGQEMEPAAMSYFEFETGLIPELQAHIEHPSIPMVAATPDGFVAGNCCIEAKSPLALTWMHTQKTGEIPSQYYWQCAWQAWCAEVPKTLFVSFHPVAPHKTKIIEYVLTKEDADAMAARVIVVEARIRGWQRILEK